MSETRVSQVQERQAPQVLCIGEVLQDCLAEQIGADLASVQSWTAYLGGAPANVACGLVKLGTPAAFIGCVGDDAVGQAIIAELKAAGVDLTGVQHHSQAPTRRVFVTRTVSGDRQFAGFGGLNTTGFADAHLAAAALPETLFQGAQYLVLGTLELAYPQSRLAIFRALELARRYQLQVLLDVNWRPIFWPEPAQAMTEIQSLLLQADYLKLSLEEAEWLFATHDPAAIVQWRSEQGYPFPATGGVLLTAGEQGCRYWLAGHSGRMSALPVEVVDTTGAGDSFVAGFLHQRCQHVAINGLAAETIAAQITYASAVAALTTTRPGAIAAQPTPAEVSHLLEQVTWGSQ